MLTVVMCTHNGSDSIGRTLDAFCHLKPPADGWKLVIVDNASSDSTPAIIRGFMSKLPLTVIQEPRPGQTHAQNTGIANVEGDFAIFTDDDILPDPDWLLEWRRVADRFPDIEVFGGRIDPEYQIPPPGYVGSSPWLGMLYSVTNPSLPEGPVPQDTATIFGPNMGFRSSLLQRGHCFDNRLGERKAGPIALMGNETDFVDRAVASGSSLGFAPTARVRHIVSRTQVTWRWILYRFYRHGRTMYFLDQQSKRDPMPTMWGAPRYLARRLTENAVKLPFVLLTCSPKRLLGHLRLMAYDLGAFHQAREMRMTVSD
jgi:glycosyltransferase involved in cell wall biosynthesis